MPAARHFSRVDSFELKLQIERKLGRLKALNYFDLLTKFLSLKISKSDFDRLCIDTIGRENVHLHNHLLRSIIKNATLSKLPPTKESKAEGSCGVKVPNGYQKISLQSLCRDFLPSPPKGRSVLSDHKLRDRRSPLGPLGKNHNIACEDSIPKIQEQSATELLSLGSRPPCSVEGGEEVHQAAVRPSIYSRSPIRAPLGHRNPDVYLKRLIKPCIDLAGTRFVRKHAGQGQGHAVPGLNGRQPMRYLQNPSRSFSAAMLGFWLAMELNPQKLGEEWPIQLEKVCFDALEE